jgi:hypothetical protein
VARCIIVTAPLLCGFLYNRFAAEPSNVPETRGSVQSDITISFKRVLPRDRFDDVGDMVSDLSFSYPENFASRRNAWFLN